MSEPIVIVAAPRVELGRKAKQLRREGWIPAVVYGQREPMHIKMENGPLRRALRVAGTTHLVNLQVDGHQYTVLAREIQQHVTRGDILHVDFMEVDMRATLTAEAELVPVGESAAVAEGEGVVTMSLRSVAIECLPGDLISEIEVDVSVIETPDDALYVRDLTPPKGVTILTDPDVVVARFEYAQQPEVEEEEEKEIIEPTAEAVEVIGKGKKEDEFEE